MDTINIFTNITSRTNVLNNLKKIWKPDDKDNPKYFYAEYEGIYFKYIPEYFYLSMNFSIPKLLYGSNTEVFDLKDTKLLFTKLNTSANSVLNNIPSVEDWLINRLDLANNYLCHSKKAKMFYIDILKNINYSRCEASGNYETSVHMHNKSIVYNMYDKHKQDSSADERILRQEFQLKNSALNRLVKQYAIPNKRFGYIMSNLPLLNKIYRDRLSSLGLQNKFLTPLQMDTFLNKLLKENKLTKRLYKNMHSYFVEGTKTICTGTLNKYKKKLSEYGVSHILSDTQLPTNIDFLNFTLYKKTIIKPKNSLKLYSLLFLFVMPLKIKIFSQFILLKNYFDDS